MRLDVGFRRRRLGRAATMIAAAIFVIPTAPSLAGGTDAAAGTAEVPTITITSSAPVVVAGAALTRLSYTVTNSGAIALTVVDIDGTLCGALTSPDGDDGDLVLGAGEAWTYSCSVMAPVADGSLLTWADTVEVTAVSDVGSISAAATISAWHLVTIHKHLYRYWNGVGDPGSLPYLHADPTTFSVHVAHDGVASGTFDLTTSTPSRFWAAAGRLTVEETELPAGYQPVAPLASLDVGPGTSTELTFVDVISADLSLSVANPSTVRRNGSVGIVYTVRNAGPASVAPRVADYRCAQVRYITGDFNRDQMLDPNEIWTYRCVYRVGMRANVSVSSFALVSESNQPMAWTLGGDAVRDDNAAFWSVRVTR